MIRIVRFLPKFTKMFGVLAAFSILLIMIMVSADVFFRYVFNAPIIGAMEFSLMLMIAVIYLGLGYTEISNRHIVIDLFYKKLNIKYQHIISKINCIILLTISSILFWHSFADFLYSYEINEILPGMASFPKYPSKLCLSLGVLIYIFVILSKLFSRRNNYE
jgi:TRAP-type mannitol/chloroaromatic compound transport system permease small subunit